MRFERQHERTQKEPLEEDDALFILQWRALQGGAATESADGQASLITVDEQARRLVLDIAERLCSGRLTPQMLTLLTNYLLSLDSKGRWKLLGLSRPTRRKAARGQATSAAYGFTNALAHGLDTAKAKIAAYDAHSAAESVASNRRPSTFNGDEQKALAKKSRFKTVAEKKMLTAVLPALRGAKLLPAASKGRPKSDIGARSDDQAKKRKSRNKYTTPGCIFSRNH